MESCENITEESCVAFNLSFKATFLCVSQARTNKATFLCVSKARTNKATFPCVSQARTNKATFLCVSQARTNKATFLCVSQVRYQQGHISVCPKPGPGYSMPYTKHDLSLCAMIWGERWFMFSSYWSNCWSSLFKLSFHSLRRIIFLEKYIVTVCLAATRNNRISKF